MAMAGDITPGMITLRYDFAAPGAQSALLGATGCVMPGTRRIAFSGDRALAWMSPDEAMLFLPHAQAPSVAAEIAAKLAPAPCLAADVSDARVIFRLSGQGAREVLAKHDENYMPPEVADALQKAGKMNNKVGSTVATTTGGKP